MDWTVNPRLGGFDSHGRSQKLEFMQTLSSKLKRLGLQGVTGAWLSVFLWKEEYVGSNPTALTKF